MDDRKRCVHITNIELGPNQELFKQQNSRCPILSISRTNRKDKRRSPTLPLLLAALIAFVVLRKFKSSDVGVSQVCITRCFT
jgi:hypothetical protein